MSFGLPCTTSSPSLARYKHMSGEYPTSTAMAAWLACPTKECSMAS